MPPSCNNCIELKQGRIQGYQSWVRVSRSSNAKTVRERKKEKSDRLTDRPTDQHTFGIIEAPVPELKKSWY